MCPTKWVLDTTPVIVIISTNRYDSFDPAIKRRSALTFEFKRPSNEQLFTLLQKNLGDLGFEDAYIKSLADNYASYPGLDYGYTYSDITQRLLPAILLKAYPDRAVTQDDVETTFNLVAPTKPFDETSNG